MIRLAQAIEQRWQLGYGADETSDKVENAPADDQDWDWEEEKDHEDEKK